MTRVSQKHMLSVLRFLTAMTVLVLAIAFPVPASAAVQDAAEMGLLGKRIVLDAGHGGPDSGARGRSGELEKDVTLRVTHDLALLLRQAGAEVHLTRTVDDDLATDQDTAMRRRQSRDLRNRTRFTLKREPDAFVSIHCNSVPSSTWHGAQTIYMTGNPEGEALAKTMQGYFHSYLLPTNRAADDMSTLFLLKRIKGPAVLAEIGFLSNTNEAVHLIHPTYQRRVAFAIYLSLLDYLGRPQTHLAEE